MQNTTHHTYRTGSQLWMVIGTLLLLALFTSCGAVDADTVMIDDATMESNNAPIVLQAKEIATPPAMPVTAGDYLIATAEQIAQLPHHDDVPVCDAAADIAQISCGGTQCVLQHALTGADNLPLVIDGAALTVIDNRNERTVACSGHHARGLITLTCEMSLRGVADVCQMVLQKI